MAKPTILFVTDLYYLAKQRRYCDEDIYLTAELRDYFNIILCHPLDTQPFEDCADVIVCRNTGPVIYYQKIYDQFKSRLLANKKVVYNSLTGQADMLGKQYLVDMTVAEYPVIPTIDKLSDISLLADVDTYVHKPKLGADSHGLETICKDDLQSLNLAGNLLQPKIDIEYEVSFYYIDGVLQYALYAPDNKCRWQLEKYPYTDKDLQFADKFIQWNKLKYGIQRVDACRTASGELLLVELEDLNPYLSLQNLEVKLRQNFIKNFKDSLDRVIKRYCV